MSASPTKIVSITGSALSQVVDTPVTELDIRNFKMLPAVPQQWLWNGRVPANKLTGLHGDPGVGKSTIALDIVARYSTQREWADGQENTCVPKSVLILAAEDDYADAIKPALEVAGANMDLVDYVEKITIHQGARKAERMLALDTDIAALRRALQKNHYGIVVIDPISSYLGKKRINVEQEVRDVLTPLKELAQEFDTAIIFVSHFNKRSDVQIALHRAGGAQAMTGVARANWFFVQDEEDHELYRMVWAKVNGAAKKKSLRYRIVEAQSSVGPIGKIQWEGEDEETVGSLLAPTNRQARQEHRAESRAAQFLRSILANGPVDSAVIKIEAQKHNIGRTALRGAKDDLFVKACKVGFGETGAWTWELPAHIQKMDSEAGF